MANPTLTLADLIERLLADPNSPRRSRQIISALRTVARLLNAEPAAIPAEPNRLRKRFEAIAPAATGLSRGRWYNVRSLTLKALQQAGIAVMRGRAHIPLAAEWEALWASLPTPAARYGLSRFMSFCTDLGIDPDAVEVATFDRFREALHNNSFVKKPHFVHRTACVLWNEAGANIQGWPTLTVPVPSASRRYALSWDSFPASFCADAEAFLYRPKHSGIFTLDYAKPVRPSTVNLRRKQILQIATALTNAGFPTERITSLGVLVDKENAQQALLYFYHRNGGQPSKYLHQQALLLKTIACHWVKASQEQIEALACFCRNLAVKNTGMTSKNRTLLRQFDHRAHVDALLGLPERIVRQVERDDRGRRSSALRVLYAVAIELLTVAPMRMKNLTELDIERHFASIQVGGSETLHLILPAEEVKNDQPYELELPPKTVQLLRLYLTRYRPRLASDQCPWLFPNHRAGHRESGSFGTSIREFVFEETGIRLHPHLFRHFAVKLHHEVHPDDMETARRLLGHKSLSTTLRSYSENNTRLAFRRYDQMIDDLRERARNRASGPSRRRKS